MYKSRILGIGHYVPDNVVTNYDLEKIMDTSDAWIQERTGIKERRHVVKGDGNTTSSMGTKAAQQALERAGVSASQIDFIVFATLSPDYFFPGPGVLVQKALGIETIGALDVRNQCSGFIYALSVADQFIKTGMYKNILVIGSEMHSGGLDMTTRGRSVSVIFGDGAGAAVLQRSEDDDVGILSTHLHSEGDHAEELALIAPNTNHNWVDDIVAQDDQKNLEYYPYMNGNFVFKNAVTRFQEVINEALDANELKPDAIDLLIPHQANLRISQYVQKQFSLPDDKIFNNIMKYGNTTAASIPIAMSEAWETGKVNKGDLICLAAFGSGFTWASALMKW